MSIRPPHLEGLFVGATGRALSLGCASLLLARQGEELAERQGVTEWL